MNPKRILVTGASGCIGHYICEALIEDTEHELYLLVRDPQKLKLDVNVRPGIHVIQGNMREIDALRGLLSTIDVAILTAAAWGGEQEAFDINVTKTVRLLQLLDPEVCEQVVYFSTESVLDQQNQLLKAAGALGTDYIRSKYIALSQIQRLAIAPKITTLFPTLVFGGDGQKPYSHLSAGLPDVVKWIGLVKFFRGDGSFHFIHARDIALVVRRLVDCPPAADEPRWLVLGNPAMTVDEAVEQACNYFGQPIRFRMPLPLWSADFFIAAFRIQMAAWDRFCLEYRHFTHENPANPATFGMTPFCPTLADIFKTRGILPDELSSQLARESNPNESAG